MNLKEFLAGWGYYSIPFHFYNRSFTVEDFYLFCLNEAVHKTQRICHDNCNKPQTCNYPIFYQIHFVSLLVFIINLFSSA